MAFLQACFKQNTSVILFERFIFQQVLRAVAYIILVLELSVVGYIRYFFNFQKNDGLIVLVVVFFSPYKFDFLAMTY